MKCEVAKDKLVKNVQAKESVKNEEAQVVNKSNAEAGAFQALSAKNRSAIKQVTPTLSGRTISYDRQDLGEMILESC